MSVEKVTFGPEPAAGRRKIIIVIFLLAVLFLALRLTVLFVRPSLVSHPEERLRGSFAMEFIDGPRMALWTYRADNYAGGSLVMGVLASAVMRILGGNFIALKLTPLFFFGLPTLILLYHFLLRHFGFCAAVYGGLLYVFSPPAFIAHSLYAVGDHQDTILFSIMLLLLCYNAHERPRAGWREFLFGCTAGFGFWVAHIMFLSFLACAAAALISPVRMPDLRRRVILVFSGFAAGASPWIVYNLATSFSGFGILHHLFLPDPSGAVRFSPDFFLRLIQVAAAGLPVSFGFQDLGEADGRIFSFLYFVVLGTAMIFAGIFCRIPAISRPVENLGALTLYPVFFLVSYAASDIPVFTDNYLHVSRYFIPCQFYFFILCAIALSRLRHPFRILFPLLALGGIALAGLVDGAAPSRPWLYKGYNSYKLGKHLSDYFYEQVRNPSELSRLLSANEVKGARGYFLNWGLIRAFPFSRYDITPAWINSWLAALKPPYRNYFSEFLGAHADALDSTFDQALKEWSPALPEDMRPHFLRGFFLSTEKTAAESAPVFQQLIEELEPSDRYIAYAGLGALFFYPEGRDQRQLEMILAGLQPEHRRWFYRGHGMNFGSEWAWSRAQFRRIWKMYKPEVPPENLPDFFWGIGWSLRREFRGDKIRAEDWLIKLPAEHRAAAQKGFEDCDLNYEISQTLAALEKSNPAYSST